MSNEKTTSNTPPATSIQDQFKNSGMEYNRTVTTPIEEKKEVVGGEGKIATSAVQSEEQIDWKARAEALEVELKKKDTVVITKVLTPEEVLAQQQKEYEELQNFVVLDKKYSALDWERFNKLKSVPAKEYLFERYKSERKQEDAELLDNVIEADFEAEYGLATVSEKALTRANANLERIANIVKAEEFKNFQNIEEEFKTTKAINAKTLEYNQLVSAAKPNIVINIKPEGFDAEVQIPVDYSDYEAEVKKQLLNSSLFNTFTAEGVNTQQAIEDYITAEVKRAKFDSIVNKSVDQLYQAKMKDIKLGSVAPPVVIQGSQPDNKKNSHPGLTQLMKEQGILNSEPPKQ